MKNLNATHLEEAVVKKNVGIYVQSPFDLINYCDDDGLEKDGIECDPFIKVYIDKKKVLTTHVNDNTQHFNVGRSVTAKIEQRNSTLIEIVVMDRDVVIANETILRTNGTVDTFMQKPIRCSEPGTFNNRPVHPNCLEIDILWQDERTIPEPEPLNLEYIETVGKNLQCQTPTVARDGKSNHRHHHGKDSHEAVRRHNQKLRESRRRQNNQ